jgi:hypothetical protein
MLFELRMVRYLSCTLQGKNVSEGLSMRPKARGLAQHGGLTGWLEEGDPTGVILYLMDGPHRLFRVLYRLP